MKSMYALALGAAVFSAGVSAQTMKPGLWEITSKTQSSNAETQQAMAQAQQQMANMPPEQRKMMQEMMARHGVQMGAGGPGGPGGSSMRVCMTKEMVARNEMPAQRGDCKTTSQSRSGNTTKMAFTCANPPSSGEGEYTVVSPEAYRMKMTMRTSMQGKPETMTMDGSGKWISADCGSVKPMR